MKCGRLDSSICLMEKEKENKKTNKTFKILIIPLFLRVNYQPSCEADGTVYPWLHKFCGQ